MAYVPGSGNIDAKLMIICECPTPQDVENGRLLSTARDLDVLLRDAGIDRNECWITAISKYPVPPNVPD